MQKTLLFINFYAISVILIIDLETISRDGERFSTSAFMVVS